MNNKKIQSIHSQLLVFYSLAAVILLVIIASVFYWEAQDVIRQADYTFVEEEANTIESILSDTVIDHALLKKSVVDHPQRTRNSLYRYYVRVVDASGNVVIETPDMASLIKKPDISDLAHYDQQKFNTHDYDGDSYLTYITRIRLNGGQSIGYIQIALDISYQHSFTHDRRFYFVILVIGLLFALFLGKVVTTRGLKRLDILTDTVKTITTSSLSQRVDPTLLPKELVNLGDAFNQMLDRIETSFTRLHQMSADLSHELRTPINNLINQTEMLLAYSNLDEEHQNAYGSNLEELQRMASLVENILFLARAESQQPALDQQQISVMSEIHKICEYYQAVADEKNTKFIVNGDAYLSVNTIMFRRMMNNLVSNAIKYSNESGLIEISVRENESGVTINVVDNGIGIDSKHLPRLFDRFFRVDDSRSKNISGNGLGLAIVKSIVELHHGQIEISSIPGKGTTVVIRFPQSTVFSHSTLDQSAAKSSSLYPSHPRQ